MVERFVKIPNPDLNNLDGHLVYFVVHFVPVVTDKRKCNSEKAFLIERSSLMWLTCSWRVLG